METIKRINWNGSFAGNDEVKEVEEDTESEAEIIKPKEEVKLPSGEKESLRISQRRKSRSNGQASMESMIQKAMAKKQD